MPQILWELSLEQMAQRMLSMEVTQQFQWRKKLASGSEETLNLEPWRQLLNWITVLSASLSLISFRVAKQESLSIWSFQKALRSQQWKCSISQRLPSRSSTMSTRMFFQSMYLLLSTSHLALPLYWKSDSRMSSRPSEKWLAPTIQRSQSTSDQTQSGNTFPFLIILSYRAKFGIDRVKNAVHCTDLPEDGTIECEYFFNILQSYQWLLFLPIALLFSDNLQF